METILTPEEVEQIEAFNQKFINFPDEGYICQAFLHFADKPNILQNEFGLTESEILYYRTRFTNFPHTT